MFAKFSTELCAIKYYYLTCLELLINNNNDNGNGNYNDNDNDNNKNNFPKDDYYY